MKKIIKIIVAILLILVICVALLALYLELRDKEYHSVYQNVHASEKWAFYEVLTRDYVNRQPDKYLIYNENLFLLVQSTEAISVLHTKPWTNEKINEHIPESIRKQFLSNLNDDSWLFKEKNN